MSSAGSTEWELKLDKVTAFNADCWAGSLFRKIKAFEMYRYVQGMKTLCDGYVILNGERFIVKPESSFGYADINRGRGFTSPGCGLWVRGV